MKTKHLYIIGNGFDIHHDIPSKFNDEKGGDCFRKWIEENDLCTLCTIEDNFGSVDDEWWNTFEVSLASIETLRIAVEEAFEHSPDFSSDNFRDRDWYEAEIAVKIRMDDVYNTISSALKKWVLQLPRGNYRKAIDIITENSLFFSFNYTNTLESIYGIHDTNILYIHGNALKDDDLILGHNSTYSKLEEAMSKYEKVSDGEYHYQCAKDAALYGIASHRKNVDKIINQNSLWFEKLYNVNYVHILGHSLCEVDIPYFTEIFNHLEITKLNVEIYYHDDDVKQKARKLMQFLHIPDIQYRTLYW